MSFNSRRSNIHVIKVPEGSRGEMCAKNVFKETKVEKFLPLAKDINL